MKALSPPFLLVFALLALLCLDKRVLLLCVLAGVGAHYVVQLLASRRHKVPPGSAVFITGCSSGIGEDAALSFSELGFHVFATVRTHAHAQALLAKANEKDNITPVIVDVSKEYDVVKAASAVSDWLKRVPGRRLMAIINNAGYCDNGPLEYIPLSAIRSQFEVNVVGQIGVTQAFLPLLRQGLPAAKKDGYFPRVIFVSSLTGLFPALLNAPYCASKAAIETLVDCMRNELVQWNIHVASVIPGTVQTSFRNKHIEKYLDRPGLDAELVSVYKKAFAKRCEMDRKLPLYVQPYSVTKSLISAVLEKYPSKRYLVGYDAHLMAWLSQLLPEQFQDLALSSIFGTTPQILRNLFSPVLPQKPHKD
eukprot:Phypoly_transcript_08849.p1 GENE.Phypoly_transcript_08849~~Phypoly_transcript_08849.p1  ORF type:complete len:364 (-),score=50.17 Phypoly_transcript_08849:267-1358(-)